MRLLCVGDCAPIVNRTETQSRGSHSRNHCTYKCDRGHHPIYGGYRSSMGEWPTSQNSHAIMVDFAKDTGSLAV